VAYGIKLHCWGEWACFTRPEMKVERVSYDVMTPSAARGIVEAIYWKPEIRWQIDRITVLKPIKFTSVRRNEVKEKIGAGTAAKAMKDGKGNLAFYVDDGDNRQQRATLMLRDVGYGSFAFSGGDSATLVLASLPQGQRQVIAGGDLPAATPMALRRDELDDNSARL